MNVLKKRFLGPFRVLEFFSTTRNDRIFLFPRDLHGTYIGMYKLMYFSWLHKKIPENCSINFIKKRFFGPFRVLDFFSTVRNDRIFLFSRTLPETYVVIRLCILFHYTRKHPKIAVSMSSKKDFWVRFGFSNFLRLFETTEFFFFLGLFQRLLSALT